MATLTFVTTCRGRLAHLQQSLPTFVAQPDSAVVVVDYDCPEHAGDWVEANHPGVEVVRATERPRFEVARARNLGAAAARSPWICFIDADILLAPDFVEKVAPILVPGHYYQARPRSLETWGTSLCESDDFDRVGGYDEVIQGWGKEDDDFYQRLALAGVRLATFPGHLVRALPHADADRVAHHEVKNRWLNDAINHVYCRAKLDIMLLQQTGVPLERRRVLYELVRAAVLEGWESARPVQIVVPYLTQETRGCGVMEARLLYTLPDPRGVRGRNR
jgi:hypothetical protein